MPLSSDCLQLAEARRIALQAQGFNDPAPRGRIDRRLFRRVLDRVGVVQIDSVNVLTRSHELPFLARLGPYDRPALARWLWGSGEVFEYWGHEASLLPVDLHPWLRWRMSQHHPWGGVRSFKTSHPGLGEAVLEAVLERGPIALGDLHHLGDAIKRPPSAPGAMWNWTPAKKAVEWFFWNGEVAALRNPQTFERLYAAPARVIPAAILAQPTPSAETAMKHLLLRAARSLGVATARSLADYHRLPIVPARRLVAELAADGALRPVAVQGWRQEAFVHPAAHLPRRVRTSALLSPFDSLIWDRQRTQDLFDVRYRIEIYVPAAQRVHGYYVLPFLHDGALVARVDLKADRAAGALLVRGSYAEPLVDPDAALPALAQRLRELADFLGLGEVRVEGRGDLAPALTGAV